MSVPPTKRARVTGVLATCLESGLLSVTEYEEFAGLVEQGLRAAAVSAAVTTTVAGGAADAAAIVDVPGYVITAVDRWLGLSHRGAGL